VLTDDGKTTLFLQPSSGLRSGLSDSGVPYKVNVYTGNKANSGTNALGKLSFLRNASLSKIIKI
jgi:hypothetical protein